MHLPMEATQRPKERKTQQNKNTSFTMGRNVAPCPEAKDAARAGPAASSSHAQGARRGELSVGSARRFSCNHTSHFIIPRYMKKWLFLEAFFKAVMLLKSGPSCLG